MLPKSKSKKGYSSGEIQQICKDRHIELVDFWDAFGVNTCALEHGEARYYQVDVERALYRLKSTDGVPHPWD